MTENFWDIVLGAKGSFVQVMHEYRKLKARLDINSLGDNGIDGLTDNDFVIIDFKDRWDDQPGVAGLLRGYGVSDRVSKFKISKHYLGPGDDGFA